MSGLKNSVTKFLKIQLSVLRSWYEVAEAHLLLLLWEVLCYHSQTVQSRRLEVFAVLARGVFGERFPSSLPILTGSNNTPIEMSVRKITIGRKTNDSLRRLGHVQLKRKVVDRIEVWIFFLLQTWVKILFKWLVYQKTWHYYMVKTLTEYRRQKWLMPSVCTEEYSMKINRTFISCSYCQYFYTKDRSAYRCYILLSTLKQTCSHGRTDFTCHELGQRKGCLPRNRTNHSLVILSCGSFKN